MRYACITRNTRETQITMSLELDRVGAGALEGTSGVGFFDHMLNSFCVHGGFYIKLDMSGDLNVDCHHTIEDVGIVLGKLFDQILADKSGICRFGERLHTAFAQVGCRGVRRHAHIGARVAVGDGEDV